MPKTNATKKAKKTTSSRGSRPAADYLVRRSPVHGTGVFATRTIKKGERVIEYAGQRISHAEADRRHADKSDDDPHTFLFTIDKKTVVDAGVGGNEARFINHSCDPNCEVMLVDGAPIVEALRTIQSGEEFAYDYNLNRAPDDSPEVDVIFACRCGASICRGTMLVPPKKPKVAARATPKATARAKPTTKARVKPKTTARARPTPAKPRRARAPSRARA